MKQFNKRPYQLVTRALLTGEEAVGALVEWVLGVRSALPVLLLLLLGLDHHRQRYVSGMSVDTSGGRD